MADDATAREAHLPRAIVVMGVSGSGKSTVARLLAEKLDWHFVEGDDFHSRANIEKMKAGHPLTDDDRWPWLARIADEIDATRRSGSHVVVACSALKRAYRDALARGHADIVIVYLKGTPALLARRLAGRQGHFMPGQLLNSQLATLEEPEAPERVIVMTIEATPDAIADAVVATLASRLV